jgi:hypothetical protein
LQALFDEETVNLAAAKAALAEEQARSSALEEENQALRGQVATVLSYLDQTNPMPKNDAETALYAEEASKVREALAQHDFDVDVLQVACKHACVNGHWAAGTFPADSVVGMLLRAIDAKRAAV